MGERERDVFYNNSFFRRLLLPREKKKRERREREGREKKRKTGERKASGPDENSEALFACFGVVIRRERDRTRLTSQQRLFSFFFLVFCVFFHFCFVFLFYCRNDVNDDDDTDAENQFHPYFADKNNTVIILEHSRVLNHHHQHERYL